MKKKALLVTALVSSMIARNYLKIRKDFGISSWVLTAAAYNVGLTRIKKAINRQGANYFTMNLNSETAAYVYKIIAVKELIEFPELYMQNFGYNVFNTAVSSNTKLTNKASDTDISAFSTIKVDVNEADGLHPNDLKKGLKKTTGNDVVEKTRDISAKVIGKYKNFKDGGSISIKLEDDLSMSNWFTAKGQILLGTGWIIDDRVMVDLGHGHNVTLFDKDNKKGISLRKLKNKQQVVLKVIDPGK